MSSTLLPPPHEQLCNRSYSNKHAHTKTPIPGLNYPRERKRERECVCVRESLGALLVTTVHNGGSRAAPAARTPHHHALSRFPTHNDGVASYIAKTFPAKKNERSCTPSWAVIYTQPTGKSHTQVDACVCGGERPRKTIKSSQELRARGA